MKQLLLAAGLTALLTAGIGCTNETNAKALVTPDRAAYFLVGSGEELLKEGKIDHWEAVTSFDGTKIDTWFKRAKVTPSQLEPLGTVVLIHDMGKNKSSYPLPDLTNELVEKGYNVILSDLRAQGRSEGKYVTYGAKEKQDIKAVVDAMAAAKLISGPIYVFGEGLGGAVAIQYAAIDPRVKGVMAVTPYKDFRSASRCWYPFPIVSNDDFEKIVKIATSMADFNEADTSSVDAAAKLTCPLLIIHGLLNLSMPYEQSEAIKAATGGPCKLEAIDTTFVPGSISERIDDLAKHGLPAE